MRACTFVPMVAWLLLAALFSGCGGSGEAADASADAAGDAGLVSPDIPWLAEGVPPIGLLPCPDGWREVTNEGVTSCDAYPESGVLDCPDGQAHFPGESGCAVVGPPCPAGGRVADLPADREVVHVLDGADGDGTAASPFGSLVAFSWGRLRPGTIVAVGRGVYDSPIRLPTGIAVWGACVTETVLTSSSPSDAEGVVTIAGSDTEIRSVGIGPAARFGVRISDADASTRLEGVWIEEAERSGLEVWRGSAEAHDLVIRGTLPMRSTNQLGIGLDMELGATVSVTRAVFQGNHTTGIYAMDGGTSLTLSDVLVRDTRSQQTDRSLGNGLTVQDGAQAQIARTVIERNRTIGVLVNAAETAVVLEDVLIRDTHSQEGDLRLGVGLGVRSGAQIDVSRTIFERNRGVGVYVAADATSAALSDVVVRDTASQESDGYFGRGMVVQFDADVAVTRAVFERNHDHGIFASPNGASLQLSDVLIRDTLSEESEGVRGRGLAVQLGARAEVSRAVLVRNQEVGVIAAGADSAGVATEVIMSDVVISDTRPNACGLDGRCADASFGMGVGSYLGASAELTRFELSGSALCGLQIALDGSLDLVDGTVSGSPIGACVQVDGYDLSRLTNSVRYRDNETNLQATDLPVPDPASSDIRL